jgi:hypothetical protein
MLAYFAIHFTKRAFLWGPQGQIDWVTYTHITSNWLALYRYNPSPVYAECLYWFAIIVTVLNVCGVFPRVMGWLFALAVSATLYRDQLAMDGGHSLLIILSIYLAFADTSALSLMKARTATARPPKFGLSVIHNAAMFAVSAQVCLMYYWAGFYKTSGSNWRHGVALYYVLRDYHFNWPGVSQLVYSHAILVVIGVYATLLFQSAFPYLMWVRPAKPAMVAIAISFHLGIAALMGLVTFSATMIAADLALLSDQQLASIWKHIATLGSFIAGRMPRIHPRSESPGLGAVVANTARDVHT